VLDTDVFVAALRSDRGASRQLLFAALDRRVMVLASVPLMLEYKAVLTRPGHLERIGVTAKEINMVLDAFAAVAEPIALRFLWRPQLKDADDEMVLETAANGGANCLATFNLRHLAPAALTFGIIAAPPGTIWRKIRGAKHEKK
jgi:putative PIN family toxin of toxin-antitoxin system